MPAQPFRAILTVGTVDRDASGKVGNYSADYVEKRAFSASAHSLDNIQFPGFEGIGQIPDHRSVVVLYNII